MSTKQPQFPPNVVDYVRQEIVRRTKYKIDLENTPKFYGYDEYSKNQNDQVRDSLEHNMKSIYESILAIVRKHMPEIEIDENPEVTIANILAALPPPDAVRKVSQVSARGQS